MAKVLSANFRPLRPRRPSGVIRYCLVAAVLLVLLYFYRNPSPDPYLQPVVQDAVAPLTNQPPPAWFNDHDTTAAGTGSGAGSGKESVSSSQETVVNSVEKSAKNAAKLADVAADKASEKASDESAEKASGKSASKSSENGASAAADAPHPIDKLIYDAQMTFAEMVSKETKTLEEAAQVYRKRRGRHPPPGFDRWFEFAQSRNSIIIEDFFDQIYHDLEPFWGMDSALLRKEAQEFEMTIHIRDGKASTANDWFWTDIWLDLIGTIEEYLPDMDLALNPMDEPRLVVAWEQINGYLQKAARTMGFTTPKDVVPKYQRLPPAGSVEPDVDVQAKIWEGSKPYWPIARRGCPPSSPARKAELQRSFDVEPLIDSSHADLHSYNGYVNNFTLSKDLCHQPDLQGLEGILIEPLTVSATATLFPMFGGSKLTVNNEILLPAPMYWNEEERFTGGNDHGMAWGDKKTEVIWRGVATGGKNKVDNWRGFQRHRFVAMNNGTKLNKIAQNAEIIENFVLPEKRYNIAAQKDGKMGDWVGDWADVGFVDLMCEPQQDEGKCEYTGHYFDVLMGTSMLEQFSSKYLPDIDGNSFSGRYLGFLRSTSLPIKAALWREWHDSRLVEWKHFVPMDSRFGDWFGIMEYFIGYKDQKGHDQAAEKIASEGKAWAEKVLRREDMQIYTMRLLLEYGRVMDDNREDMGWVDDALKDPSIEKTWAKW